MAATTDRVEGQADLCGRSLALPLLGLVLLLGGTPVARAETALCLEVHTAAEEQREGFARLIRSEVARHPSHALVDQAECPTTLYVELFQTGGLRYLTARTNQEIPVRYVIESDAVLAERLATALTLVLGNDPVSLAEDIGQFNLAQRAAHSVLQRGHNFYRLELSQTVGRSNGVAAFAPTGAFALTRGADSWQVFARAYLGGWPGAPTGGDAVIRLLTGADLGLTYELLEQESVSPYISAGLGLQFLRFEGRPDLTQPKQIDVVNQFLVGLTVRLGVRFLRYFDFDCDLFAAAHLPFFNTHDEDSTLLDHYTPTFEFGVGVGF